MKPGSQAEQGGGVYRKIIIEYKYMHNGQKALIYWYVIKQ